MPRILLIETYPVLLTQRRHAFESAGYEVYVSSVSQAFGLIERKRFDAVVLGHAIDEQERERLTSATTTKQRSCKVVCLYLGSIRNAEVANAVLQATSPVEDLVRAVDELVSPDRRQPA